MRRKKLCFTYQEPWVPGHRCAGKAKAHYIEVYSDSDEDEYEQEATEELRAAEEESHQRESLLHYLEYQDSILSRSKE